MRTAHSMGQSCLASSNADPPQCWAPNAPAEQFKHHHSPWKSICSTAVNTALIFCTAALQLQHRLSPVCSTTKDKTKRPENAGTDLVCLRR